MPRKTFKVTAADRLELAAVLETPDSPPPFALVVLIHGYNSGKDSLTNLALAPRLAEQGIASLRFDFRGHRDSQGMIEDVNLTTGLTDLATVMAWVRQNTEITQDRVALMGGSYGGVVATLYTAQHPQAIRCLVLKAPASDWGEARSLRMSRQEMAEWKRSGYHLLEKQPRPIKVPYSFYEDITSYDTYALAPQITCPVLIVHGDADRSVPIAQSRKLAGLLGGPVTFREFPGADHRFTGEADFAAMIDASTEFLSAQI